MRQKAEHEDRIRRAKAVIREWNNLETHSNLDWKLWLKDRLPDITEKFITRWANRKKLPQPEEAMHHPLGEPSTAKRRRKRTRRK